MYTKNKLLQPRIQIHRGHEQVHDRRDGLADRGTQPASRVGLTGTARAVAARLAAEVQQVVDRPRGFGDLPLPMGRHSRPVTASSALNGRW